MPTPQQLRDRLLKKLKELFQLDQPDLDFGFYRIMHAKSVQVQEFIQKDLLKIVADAFGQVDEARSAGLRLVYEKTLETAKEFGAPEPEKVPRVQEAKAKWESCKDTATAEADIYDHLYRFFERYYDGGDFMSRRYYARETSGKAAPYAIPYNGEEVKLHWANADQYYIKTAEYFSNFTCDLTQAAEIRAMSDEQRVLQQIPDHPVKVHFRIADATEGEHGNVKASEANKRFFIIHGEKPVDATDEGELVIYFEYRPDPEKTGQDNTWREKRNADAVEAILKILEGNLQITKTNLDEYLRLLTFPAPTDKDKNRPLLAKYINQYTARNTMDYFIHKDLGGFLRRELDFYIKNEVMRLDDIENADAPLVDAWLTKVKVLRKIAGKLIDFLAQLEDFQKKLWLKKKFVVETNYCITLDRIPEALYPEIAANEAQHDEWLRLFAIDERFKARLIASIENFDEQCDGLLIHSENFQTLNLLRERYRAQVKCVYIDPPYNTGGDGFAYKDSYQHASWLTMISERLLAAYPLLTDDGVLFSSIDAIERNRLEHALNIVFQTSNRVEEILMNSNWYILYIPESRLKPSNYQDVLLIQQVATELLKRYCDHLYNYSKRAYIEPRLELRELTGADDNFPERDKDRTDGAWCDYQIIVDGDNQTLINNIEQIKQDIAARKKDLLQIGDLDACAFGKHLFQPLFHVRKNGKITIQPVALNESEFRFVCDLKEWCEEHNLALKEEGIELFLLRNMSRGKGVGFFEAGRFHPDFILWMLKADKQYVTFIDPHGLLHGSGIGDEKIKLHKGIKEIEKRLNDPKVILNSFILSWTKYPQLKWNKEQKELEDMHVLFMQDDRDQYIDKLLLITDLGE